MVYGKSSLLGSMAESRIDAVINAAGYGRLVIRTVRGSPGEIVPQLLQRVRQSRPAWTSSRSSTGTGGRSRAAPIQARHPVPEITERNSTPIRPVFLRTTSRVNKQITEVFIPVTGVFFLDGIERVLKVRVFLL